MPLLDKRRAGEGAEAFGARWERRRLRARKWRRARLAVLFVAAAVALTAAGRSYWRDRNQIIEAFAPPPAVQRRLPPAPTNLAGPIELPSASQEDDRQFSPTMRFDTRDAQTAGGHKDAAPMLSAQPNATQAVEEVRERQEIAMLRFNERRLEFEREQEVKRRVFGSLEVTGLVVLAGFVLIILFSGLGRIAVFTIVHGRLPLK